MYDILPPDQLTDTYTALGPTRERCAPILGEIRRDTTGTKTYKFVKNLHSVALTVGDFVAYAYANAKRTEVNIPATGRLHVMAGVAMGAIPVNGFGWIQCIGLGSGLVTSSASIAAGTSLKLANAALAAVHDAAVDVQPAHFNHAVALAAHNPGGNALASVYVNCPVGL